MEIIIKNDWIPPTFSAKMKCHYCKSLLRINAEDVHNEWDSDGNYYCIKCPVCNHRPTLPFNVEQKYRKYLRSK